MKGSKAGLETRVQAPELLPQLGAMGSHWRVLSQGVTDQDCGLSGYGGAEDGLEGDN